ncbi:MAG: putative DCC family thiol-disulfide oxidoreductase YuxK [Burkholderiaceae bacterium]|jgi:predicted DCC family thiol-disulfide oxidoreductase YuxK
MNSPFNAPQSVSVFFDGSCPMCQREVRMYRKIPSTVPIQWVDVSSNLQDNTTGRSCTELMARFHVRTADGAVLSGARAFVALWLLFPSWRWLGRIGSLPLMPAILEVAYRGFLLIRPGIQWIFRKIYPDPMPGK